MSTFAQNSVQQLFVGGTASKTASGNITQANAGEIVVVDADGGSILTEATAATTDKFKIGINRGTNIDVVSDVIEKSKIKFIGAKQYEAAQEQITYVGYNGTAGSIAVNDNEQYYIRLYLEDFIRSSSDGRRIKHGMYRSGNSTTQELIAQGVTRSLIKNFTREPERQIKFERVCDEAGSAITGTVTGGNVVTGSDIVEINGTLTNVSVGDTIRLGGTDVTDPVYKVLEYTASSYIKLDTPYQGADEAIAVGNIEVITAGAAAAAEFGLKLTGLPLDFKLGKIQYKKTRFEAQVDSTEGFDETPISNAQAAKQGTGTIETVSELEWFAQGHEGEFFRMGEPNIFDPRKDTDPSVAGGGYDFIDIFFVDDSVVGFQPNVSKKHVTLAIPATTPDYAATAEDDDITDVLEVLAKGSADGSLALG